MKKAYNIQQYILFFISFLYLFTCSSLDIKAETPIIFPIPQQMLLTQDIFTLDGTVSIVIPENASEKDVSLARFMVGELSTKYGLALKIEKLSKIPGNRKVILMGNISNPLIKKYCTDNKLEINQKNPGSEGYILQVSNKLVVVGGWDDPGAFFGMQSLRQLIQNGNGKEIQGLRVRDWPSLPFRGIRLYVPGPENFVFFNRFIKDFMALYKYNKLILEVNCMRLDKHPEVNAGWIEFSKYMQYTRSNSTEGLHGETKNSSHHDCGDGFIIEKKDVRNIVEFANQNFIEVIPEIPSLTHGYYLLTRHPELAEYPGDKWPDTYCPSNPASYKLMFDVYDEYMEVIKPKMVHIGHDEWWGAPLGNCPLCTGKDHSELFAGDITKIHDYFAKKGVKIAMWGDYLLESVRDTLTQDRISSTGMKYQTPGAVRPEIVQKSIPKDILVFNWFWKSEKKEMELQKFGFKQIYGNFTPGITNWEERIKKVDIIGGAPSVWTSTNEFNIGKECMVDFLGCSNLLWSTHIIKPLELGEIVRSMTSTIRSNLKGKRIPSADGDSVVPVTTNSYLNLSAATTAFNIKLNTLKEGKIQYKSMYFELPNADKSSGNSLIAVGSLGTGENIQPQKVDGIAINEDVSSLLFLHACAIPAGNQKTYFNIPDFFDSADLLGWYEIVYEDGYKEMVPIQYGVNILEWNPGGEKSLDKYVGSTGSSQGTYCYEADAIECSNDMKGNPVTFYAYEWVNKRFGKVIKEVNLHGSINYQATQQDYGKVETAPMAGNAVILAAISKVVKRMPYIPK